MLEFALIVYFFVYLFKDAAIMNPFRVQIYKLPNKMQFSKFAAVGWLGEKLKYMFACAFCLSFWACLGMAIFGAIPYDFILKVPVVCLALDSILKAGEKEILY